MLLTLMTKKIIASLLMMCRKSIIGLKMTVILFLAVDAIFAAASRYKTSEPLLLFLDGRPRTV